MEIVPDGGSDGGSDGTLDVRGVTLSYDVTGGSSGQMSGGAPTVVFAHGMSASRANNVPAGLMDFTPVADAGFRLIRYDARGHGRSAGTPDPADYHWPALADDLLALLDELAPDQPVAAIGNSMGTGTILHAALLAPERFSALVLTAPPTAWDTRAAQRDTYLMMAEALETGDPERLQRLLGRFAEPEIFAGLMDEPPMPDVAAGLFPTVLSGAAGTDLPPREELAALTQPTLITPWATDPGHPVSTAEALAEVMPNARLRVARTPAEIAEFGRWAADFLVETVGATGTRG